MFIYMNAQLEQFVPPSSQNPGYALDYHDNFVNNIIDAKNNACKE